MVVFEVLASRAMSSMATSSKPRFAKNSCATWRICRSRCGGFFLPLEGFGGFICMPEAKRRLLDERHARDFLVTHSRTDPRFELDVARRLGGCQHLARLVE